jgi:hypothetical protein
MPIQQLLKEQSFDPDDINLLSRAFEEALQTLGLVDRTVPAAQLRPGASSKRPRAGLISGPQGKSEDQPHAKQIAPAEGVTPPGWALTWWCSQCR